MKFWHALCGGALFALSCAGAVAQEDPEAVYAKMHGATLAGNTTEVLGYGTASAQAELASKSQAEKDAVVRSLAVILPKTYTITEKTIAPDGNSAVLRGTGISEAMGARSELHLNAAFRKEGGAWKVSSWSWSNQKPPPPAAKPAAPDAATAPAADAVAPQQVVITRTVGPLPAAAAPARTEVAPASVAVAKRPSRAHLDARECLKLPTDKAIMACAERFR